VDDRPFGGGEGMVLKAQPIAEALESLGIRTKGERQVSALSQGTTSVVPIEPPKADLALAPAEVVASREVDSSATDELSSQRPTVILLSAQGRPFTQAVARELAQMERVVLICGRYEGVDERINDLYCDMELSIGDYVLSGGELAAAIVIDAAMRLIPGVLGNEASGEFESFGASDAEIETDVDGVPRSQHGAGGLLDYPHYTRPADFGGIKVPDPLLNGDHLGIRRWRREQQLRKTLKNRPDLLANASLSKEDHKLLEAIRRET
jgi:tRNA (guanine37-N1)-methyltransferase